MAVPIHETGNVGLGLLAGLQGFWDVWGVGVGLGVIVGVGLRVAVGSGADASGSSFLSSR